jgi:ketosteroid isomerase-like protein
MGGTLFGEADRSARASRRDSLRAVGYELETLARRFVDAYNARDADALVAVSHPEIAFYPTMLVGARRRFDGHDGLRDWMGHLAAAGAEFQARIVEIRVLGPDRFAILSEVWIGEEVGSDSAMIATVRDGLIAEARGYLTDERTLIELGLIPEPPTAP